MKLVFDDKTITSRIAVGDSEAENYLFSHFKERIKLMVRVRLRGKVPIEDQEDIISEIQHAILVSLRKGGYDQSTGKPLEAYIAGIAGNVVALYFRKQKKLLLNEISLREDTIGYIDSLQHLKKQENALSDLIDEERREKLRNCLKRLKQKYREVLILRAYENKSIEEIAKQLNLEPRRVSERINYAFKLLLKECKKDKYFQYFDNYCK